MESVKFKTGDKVKRTGDDWESAGVFTSCVYTVDGIYTDGRWLSLVESNKKFLGDNTYPFSVEFFEVITTSKFKIGDYVVRTEQEHNFMETGDVDIVMRVYGDIIDLKDNGPGHWDVFFEHSTESAYLDQEATKTKVAAGSVTLTAKDTNPKDAVGTKKAPMSTVSALVLQEVGVAMLEGARKYGRHNYRIAGVRSSVYYDAAMRHLMAYWEGQDTDPDSGLSHITKAIAGLVVLRDAQINNMVVDDRPPSIIDFAEVANSLQQSVDEIFKRIPESKPAYTREDK